jgi:hypothetical protein
LPISSLPRFFAAAEPHRLAVLKALWPSVAGNALSNHSEVVGIQGEVMRIRVDSTSWLKTLRDLRGTLILRLQRAAGPLAPRGLALVEGRVAPGPPRRSRFKPVKPLPVSALPEQISASAGRIPTAEGRDAYLRAAAAFRARFGSVRRP